MLHAYFHDQINELIVKHDYRRYVESLLNRMVRTQPGKGAVAQDEYLEMGCHPRRSTRFTVVSRFRDFTNQDIDTTLIFYEV